MREWTEQEEQEMIARAKTGDAQANYELSLWAQRRSEEEPDEPRWNRLAAKCLVKAAQQGCAPAQERMAELLRQSQEGAQAAQQEEPDEPPMQEPVRLSDARQAAARRRQTSAGSVQTTARRPARRSAQPQEEELPEEDYEDEDDYEDEQTSQRGSAFKNPFSGGRFSNWSEGQWRKVEYICVAVCAALLVLIAVMIITGRNSGSTGSGGGASAIPPAGLASAAATASPEPAEYPPADVIAAIQAAELEIPPEDEEYVTVPTTATVKVSSSSLRLRTAPNTEYKEIARMPDGTELDIYATKNDWCLVRYEDSEKGTLYGWCSSEYLLITSGAADASSVG